jgi:cytidylate kinase
MSEHNDHHIEQMRAVTISREYGSGGGEIAKRLATQLGWQVIDHDIVWRIAQEMNVSEQEAQVRDEQVESLLVRILNSMQKVDAPFMVTAPPLGVITTNPQEYRDALIKVIDAAVARGHVVIVGRASQILLAERRDVLHVRIVAPLEMRVAYVMKREGLSREQALTRIQGKERDRQRYLQSEFKQDPEDAHLYDLIVNSAVLTLDSIVSLAYCALRYKAAQIAVAAEDLGPGAGMTQYPGQPADFPLPEPQS